MLKAKSNKNKKFQITLHACKEQTDEYKTAALVELCGHNYLQAIQCVLLSQKIGHYVIFVDWEQDALDVYHKLRHDGLRVTLEKYKRV
jgi:hypothetical protein